MIELLNDQLSFSFGDVHPDAKLGIEFQRTLRIPDDGDSHLLPPGLGNFPVCHVDDFADKVSEQWLKRGGVIFPMYQSEALWLNFNGKHVHDRNTSYPFAIKVAAGKINAVSGEGWGKGIKQDPQDYMVSNKQPWLDGYCVGNGSIRQFVAMPLGSGYSAEEQISGEAEHGGLQIEVYPMKREVFERNFPKRDSRAWECQSRYVLGTQAWLCEAPGSPDMGLAPGGKMRQQVYHDPFDIHSWDLENSSRCYVHIANSLVWQAITGKVPPSPPPTARQYSKAGLPWFDYYSDAKSVGGSSILDKLKSVVTLGREKGDNPLPENASAPPEKVIVLRDGLGKNEVRDGAF
ncbi:MAG: hypothetical protein ACR2RV_14665 [Verrucomicrobiales bacterium]